MHPLAASSLERRTRATWERCSAQLCVEFKGRSFSWGDVARFALQLDALLSAHGCHRGHRVAVIARSTPGVLASQYALLGTGRELVIVNPFAPQAAIASELARLAPLVVIAHARDWDTPELAQWQGPAHALAVRIGHDDLSAPIANTPAHWAGLPSVSPGDAAAVEMLTSGTTGAPKRARMRADTVDAAGQDAWDTLTDIERYTASADRAQPFLNFWPLTNVGGLSFVFHAALEGRAMVLFERFDVAAYVEAVRRWQPAVLTLPPAQLRMVMAAQVAPSDLACAAVVRSANAPLDPSLRDEFEAAYRIPIMTYYGVTEFCGVVSGWPMEVFMRLRKSKAASVGLPRPGVGFRIVLQAGGKALPPDAIGTLEVRVGRLGPQWITTSDMGRIDADGFLFLEGRADGAINRGGFKILPETIVQALRTHPAVYDAAVIGLTDERLGAVPIAFVELREGAALVSETQLRDYLRGKLVAYQVPQRVHVLSQLPRTPTMKVNIAQLDDIARANPDAQ